MSLPLQQVHIRSYGGGNWADESLTLFPRSFSFDGGFRQTAPMEATDLQNMDFFQRDLAKRKGSALIDDSSSVHAASETILGGFAVDTTQFLVGAKSIYRKASGGSWTRMKAPGGASDYAHAATVSKWSVAFGDGYAFLGVDGANKIQVVNPASNELKPSLDNPGPGNNYTEQKGGGTKPCTGTWGTGYYIVVWFQNRLCFSTGDSILEFTNVNKPYDLAGGGFWQFNGDLVASTTFVPRGQNELLERLFGFTTNGLQIISGFDGNDAPMNMAGAGVPICHRSLAVAQNWILYPTRQQTIEAANLVEIKDLGRRMLNGDGSTGPMDNFDPSNTSHATLGFSFYDRNKQQVKYWGPDGATRSTNSMAWGIDLDLGEPIINEPLDSVEKHVRCLWDAIKEPASNAWFVGMYQANDTIVGVLANGKTYTYNSGDNDLGTIAIEEYWETAEFDAGDPSIITNFRRLAPLFRESGDWNVNVLRYLDLSPFSTGAAVAFGQVNTGTTLWGGSTWGGGTWGGGGVVRTAKWLEVYARSLRLRFYNQNAGETWRMPSMVLEFQVGNRQD